MKHKAFSILVVAVAAFSLAGWIQAAGPTAADVGDAETFGHPALYLGAASGFVTLSPDCSTEPSPTPTPPDSQCFNLNPPPAPTTFNAENICRIKLPKKATRNVIYPVLNMLVSYQLENSTGAAVPNALFTFNASLSIESAALLAPTVIDPGTGLPAAGKITLLFNYNYRDDRSMKDGDRQRFREVMVRAGNTGLTRSQFINSFGLAPGVVDAMFLGEMTVKMNVTGTARYLTDANITGNMRLFGD